MNYGHFTMIALCATITALTGIVRSEPLPRVRPRGEDFVDPAGSPVRFWGVNLVSLFPTHAESERIAENLAERGINLVRPHHLLRPSSDWIHRAGVLGLNQLRDNTRDPDPEAWDRFDYLNAQLRKHGIYLSMSLHFSRTFLPGDADVLETTPADREAWMAAVAEMRSWDWRKSIDPFKMLPTFDPRALALQEEFARKLLEHVNPYTGLTYAQDPQVLTIEVVNESSAEYCLVCGNTFAPYFLGTLDAAWGDFLRARGSEAFDLQQGRSNEQRLLRSEFYRSLDENLMKHMSRVIRSTGSEAAITYSNLWRGEANLRMHDEHSDFIEDHSYMDPLVVRSLEDGFQAHGRTLLRGKPYMLGEFNQSEGEANLRSQSPNRTMLPLAAAAYGSFHGYAGITWFAWCHGDRTIGADGWALQEGRESRLGDMVSDGMMLDHLRTSSLIFRRGLAAPSAKPAVLTVDEPHHAFDYNGLMAGKYRVRAGWPNLRSIRKTFGPLPAEQSAAEWLTSEPESPLVSDTGEIVKDVARRQLTLAAPLAEAFSGYLDGQAPAGLKHLVLEGDLDFATIVAVSLEDLPLAETRRLLLSRTCVGADGRDRTGPVLTIQGLRTPTPGEAWAVRLTRPRQSAALLKAFAPEGYGNLKVDAAGAVRLPDADWHECELVLAETAMPER